jgi:hypothetical protein
MARKRKKATRPDSAVEEILLAEEDLAAMRPALAVAPELVVQTLARKRRRRPQKQAKKKVKKARKSSAKKARKSARKRKKAKTTGESSRYGVDARRGSHSRFPPKVRTGRAAPYLVFGRAAESALSTRAALRQNWLNGPVHKAAGGDDHVIDVID